MKLGDLRIFSTLFPFQRAGIAFATREPVVLPIVELDGKRLRALLLDPAIRMEMADADDGFIPFSDLLGPISEKTPVKAFDEFIGGIVKNLPSVDPTEPEDTIESLREQLANAKAGIANRDDEIQRIQGEAAATTNAHKDVIERLNKASSEISSLTSENSALKAKVGELESEIAGLKAKDTTAPETNRASAAEVDSAAGVKPKAAKPKAS